MRAIPDITAESGMTAPDFVTGQWVVYASGLLETNGQPQRKHTHKQK